MSFFCKRRKQHSLYSFSESSSLPYLVDGRVDGLADGQVVNGVGGLFLKFFFAIFLISGLRLSREGAER